MKEPKKQYVELEHVEDYLKHGEDAAIYMEGLADALETVAQPTTKSLVHHLRCHAHELNMGTLQVRHGYVVNKGGTK